MRSISAVDMKRLLAVTIVAAVACRTESAQSSTASAGSAGDPAQTVPDEADVRRDASLRWWNLQAGSDADTFEYATGALAGRRNEVFCTTLAGDVVERILLVSLDGEPTDYSTSSKIDAFLLSPRTCLIVVEPIELWNEYPFLVLELKRTVHGWAPVTSGLVDQPDFNSGIREPNEVRWFHPREGRVVVDGADPDVNAPIRISYRCRIPQAEGVGDIVLVAQFEVAPKELPEDRSRAIQQFIEDARVGERW